MTEKIARTTHIVTLPFYVAGILKEDGYGRLSRGIEVNVEGVRRWEMHWDTLGAALAEFEMAQEAFLVAQEAFAGVIGQLWNVPTNNYIKPERKG